MRHDKTGFGTRPLAAAALIAITVVACGSEGTDGTSAPEGEAETVRPPEASPPPPRTLAATELREVRLADAPVTIALAVPGNVSGRIRTLAAAGEPGHLWLTVDGLRQLRQGGYYQIYLNLPEGQTPDPQGPHFVGNISLYGATEDESAQAFDITDEVREVQARGLFQGPLRVTFVLGNPEPKTAAADALMSFRRILIEER